MSDKTTAPVVKAAIASEDIGSRFEEDPGLARRVKSQHRRPHIEGQPVGSAADRGTARNATSARRFQPGEVRLYVSRPGDALETEADQAVEGWLGRSPKKKGPPGRPGERPRVTKPGAGVTSQSWGRPLKPGTLSGQAKAGDHGLESRLQTLRGGGQPLPAATSRYFHERFGFDFDPVRVHTGARAAEVARLAGARALTSGKDVVFNRNEYAPETDRGLRLLGHELIHVIQQRGMNTSLTPVFRQAVPGQTSLVDVGSASAVPPAADKVKDAANPKLNPPEPKDQAPNKDEPKPEDEAVGAKQPIATDKEADETAKALKDQAKEVGKDDQFGKGEAAAKGKEAAVSTEGAEGEAKAEPQAVSDISTGGLALIDEELAEHQRWAGAVAIVGAAGSETRGTFVAAAVLAGEAGGLGSGFVEGLKTGAGIRGAEFVAGKAFVGTAAKYAAKYGTQAAKFTPLPAVGAVIGGAMSAYELIGRDWSKTGETIGRFGQGSDTYEKLANSIEAISTYYDVVTQVMNVIAGVVGAIAIASWAISIATLGVASPLSVTLTAIAAAIGIAAMIIDGINAVILKQLVVVFRALHAFTSDADPTEVVAQGKQIGQAAEGASGFLGGLAGGLTASHAGKGGKPNVPVPDPVKPPPEHTTPPPATGDGPVVKAEPSAEGAGTKPATGDVIGSQEGTSGSGTHSMDSVKLPGKEPPEVKVAPATGAVPPGTGVPAGEHGEPAAASKPPADTKPESIEDLRQKALEKEVSFAELKDIMDELDKGPFGDKIQAEATRAQQPPPAAPPGTKGGYGLLRRLLIQEHARPLGSQAQHWTKWLESTTKLPLGVQRMITELISRNRSWLQSRRNLPATLLLSDPAGGGTRYTVGEHAAPRPTGQLELPGFDNRPVEQRYGTEHKFADAYLIPEEAQRIRDRNPGADPNLVNLWAGAAARSRMEGIPGQGDWGWQARSSGGTQIPLFPDTAKAPAPSRSVPPDPRQLSFDFGKPTQNTNPNQLELFPDVAAQTDVTPSPSSAVPVRIAEPKLRIAEPKLRIAEPNITDEMPLEEEPESQEEKLLLRLNAAADIGKAGQRGKVEGEDKETKGGFWSNLSQFGQEESKSMTPAKAGVLGTLGPGALYAGWAADKAMKGFEKARREPIVEKVNPHYPDPPGTLEDQTRLQKEVLDILQARAQAEAAAKVMGREEQKHKANEEPIGKAKKGTEDAVSASEAHKKAVERRQEANKKSGEKEGEAAKSIADYGGKASKLVVITGPLHAFERFTYLATYLPNTPDVLVGVKRSILKVHSDSQKLLNALDNADNAMKQQGQQQPKRADNIKGDGTKLDKTNQGADKSTDSLKQAQQGADNLEAGNKENRDLATKSKKESEGDAQKLDAHAKEKQAQVESLAAAWQSWSVRHRQARLDAMKQTEERMAKAGYKILESKER
jgi:hypothetical protein